MFPCGKYWIFLGFIVKWATVMLCTSQTKSNCLEIARLPDIFISVPRKFIFPVAFLRTQFIRVYLALKPAPIKWISKQQKRENFSFGWFSFNVYGGTGRFQSYNAFEQKLRTFQWTGNGHRMPHAAQSNDFVFRCAHILKSNKDMLILRRMWISHSRSLSLPLCDRCLLMSCVSVWMKGNETKVRGAMVLHAKRRIQNSNKPAKQNDVEGDETNWL